MSHNKSPYHITHHAIARALDMALDPHEITQAVQRPDKPPWESPSYPGVWLHQAGRVTAACRYDHRDGKPVILTLLWSTAEDWQRDALLPPADGREYRPNPFHPRERAEQ